MPSTFQEVVPDLTDAHFAQTFNPAAQMSERSPAPPTTTTTKKKTLILSELSPEEFEIVRQKVVKTVDWIAKDFERTLSNRRRNDGALPADTEGIIVYADSCPGAGKTTAFNYLAKWLRSVIARSYRYVEEQVQKAGLEEGAPPMGGTGAVFWGSSGMLAPDILPDEVGGPPRRIAQQDKRRRSASLATASVGIDTLKPKRRPEPETSETTSEAGPEDWRSRWRQLKKLTCVGIRGDAPLLWGADQTHVLDPEGDVDDFATQLELASCSQFAMMDLVSHVIEKMEAYKTLVRETPAEIRRISGMAPYLPPIILVDGSDLQNVAFAVLRYAQGRLDEEQVRVLVHGALSNFEKLSETWPAAIWARMTILPDQSELVERLMLRQRPGEIAMGEAEIRATSLLLTYVYERLSPIGMNYAWADPDTSVLVEMAASTIYRYGVASRNYFLPRSMPVTEHVALRRLQQAGEKRHARRREFCRESGPHSLRARILRQLESYLEEGEGDTDAPAKERRDDLPITEIAEILAIKPSLLVRGRSSFHFLPLSARISRTLRHEGPLPAWERLLDLSLPPLFFLSDGIETYDPWLCLGGGPVSMTHPDGQVVDLQDGRGLDLSFCYLPTRNDDWLRQSPDSGFYVALPRFEVRADLPTDAFARSTPLPPIAKLTLPRNALYLFRTRISKAMESGPYEFRVAQTPETLRIMQEDWALRLAGDIFRVSGMTSPETGVRQAAHVRAAVALPRVKHALVYHRPGEKRSISYRRLATHFNERWGLHLYIVDPDFDKIAT